MSCMSGASGASKVLRDAQPPAVLSGDSVVPWVGPNALFTYGTWYILVNSCYSVLRVPGCWYSVVQITCGHPERPC